MAKTVSTKTECTARVYHLVIAMPPVPATDPTRPLLCRVAAPSPRRVLQWHVGYFDGKVT